MFITKAGSNNVLFGYMYFHCPTIFYLCIYYLQNNWIIETCLIKLFTSILSEYTVNRIVQY